MNDEEVHFNIYYIMKFPTRGQSCNKISVVDKCVKEVVDGVFMDDRLEYFLFTRPSEKLVCQPHIQSSVVLMWRMSI